MSDVTCPYCGADQEINHDDGYGYDEGVEHNQECSECEKEFKFFTSIYFTYRVYCHDDDHIMEQSQIEDCSSLRFCSKCDNNERRDDT